MITLIQAGAPAIDAITPRQMLSATALCIGAIAVLAGLSWLFVQEHRRQRLERRTVAAAAVTGSDPKERAWPQLAVLLLIGLVGAWLRLEGLDVKTLTHTEAIVPNLPFPAGITWPPPRHSFYDAFWWHFHGEGHPQAYYFLMWGWTHLFGTDLFTIRLPSALFGIGCIGLTYGIGTSTYDRRVGLMGAALVAFSGLHIYFSQYARLFMMGTFLSLLSTFVLLEAMRRTRHRLRWEIAYVLVSWVAVYTQTFFWTVLLVQMVWVMWQRPSAPGRVTRFLGLQALVVALGAPSLAHIIYRGDDVDLAGPSIAFVAQYLAFGWAVQPDDISVPARAIPTAVIAPIAALGVLLVGLGFRVRARPSYAPTDGQPLPLRRMLPVALGSALVVLGLTIVALRHQAAMAPVIALPFLALAAPGIGSRLGSLLPRLRALPGDDGPSARGPSIVVLLAVVPPLIVLALSFWTSMLIPRAFLMFVPYLLLVMAAGAATLLRPRAVAVGLAGALAVIHTASILFYRDFPNDGIDYAGLGEQMRERIAAGDLVFVVPDAWFVTPVFYYLDNHGHSYVASDYEAAVARHPGARVWLLFFESVRWGPYGSTTDEMAAALAGFQPRDEVEARRARAVVYAPDR